jgi:hypothetical protein
LSCDASAVVCVIVYELHSINRKPNNEHVLL